MESKHFGPIEIVGEGRQSNYVKVKFINTGYIGEYRRDAVYRGEVRDKYAVTLCGVGIIGDIKTRGHYARYYHVWRNMIMRCYSEGNNKAYYGHVRVADRWKVFENFYNDAPLITGWDQAAFERGDLVLDKDLKQRHQTGKIYSLQTCTWLRQSENAPIQDKQQRVFIAVGPDGQEYISDNISAFARQHGLTRRQISAVLHGRFHTTHGWKFHFSDDEMTQTHCSEQCQSIA